MAQIKHPDYLFECEKSRLLATVWTNIAMDWYTLRETIHVTRNVCLNSSFSFLCLCRLSLEYLFCSQGEIKSLKWTAVRLDACKQTIVVTTNKMIKIKNDIPIERTTRSGIFVLFFIHQRHQPAHCMLIIWIICNVIGLFDRYNGSRLNFMVYSLLLNY